jgi:hypothetical protein
MDASFVTILAADAVLPGISGSASVTSTSALSHLTATNPAATGRTDPAGTFTTTASYKLGYWTDVAGLTTTGMIVLYNRATGETATGSVTRTGCTPA